MKQVVTILSIFILFSCNTNKQTPATPGNAKIVAVWTKPDSSKEISIMYRSIYKQVLFDSASKTDRIVIDTAWGYPIPQALLDSTGKVILDSITKQPRLSPEPRYIFISKDSVNWRIAGIPLEELLKKSK
jgi:hypothetical protein